MLSWFALKQRVYILESLTHIDAGNWVPVAVVIGQNDVVTVTNVPAANTRAFRLKVQMLEP